MSSFVNGQHNHLFENGRARRAQKVFVTGKRQIAAAPAIRRAMSRLASSSSPGGLEDSGAAQSTSASQTTERPKRTRGRPPPTDRHAEQIEQDPFRATRCRPRRETRLLLLAGGPRWVARAGELCYNGQRLLRLVARRTSQAKASSSRTLGHLEFAPVRMRRCGESYRDRTAATDGRPGFESCTLLLPQMANGHAHWSATVCTVCCWT